VLPVQHGPEVLAHPGMAAQSSRLPRKSDMTGLNTLRIALSTIAKSHRDLEMLAWVTERRPPKCLDAVEQALLAHLADTEDALAHVRRMQIVNERDDVAA
jgi:hypothetical protein